jgi:hypothetical protein
LPSTETSTVPLSPLLDDRPPDEKVPRDSPAEVAEADETDAELELAEVEALAVVPLAAAAVTNGLAAKLANALETLAPGD